jgi:hypothetical protein
MYKDFWIHFVLATIFAAAVGMMLSGCTTVCPPGQTGQPGRCIPQPTPDACDHVSAEAFVACIHTYEPMEDADRLRCINQADEVFNNCKGPNATSSFSNSSVVK